MLKDTGKLELKRRNKVFVKIFHLPTFFKEFPKLIRGNYCLEFPQMSVSRDFEDLEELKQVLFDWFPEFSTATIE